MNIRELVGYHVRRFRAERELTQEALAEKSGYSQQYISGLEAGLRNPTLETLLDLAQALNVAHTDLLQLPAGQRLTKSKRSK